MSLINHQGVESSLLSFEDYNAVTDPFLSDFLVRYEVLYTLWYTLLLATKQLVLHLPCGEMGAYTEIWFGYRRASRDMKRKGMTVNLQLKNRTATQRALASNVHYQTGF